MRVVSPLSQRFPFGGVLLAAICGILLASLLGATWWLLGVLLMGAILLFPLRREGGAVLAMTVVVFALLQLGSWNESPARKLALWLEAPPRDFQVQGIVAAEPRIPPSGRASFPLRVEKIEELDGTRNAITLPVTVQVRWEGESPSYGDRVRFQAVATSPPPAHNPGTFDYRNWLERHGIYTQFRVDPSEPGIILSHGHGNPVMAWAIFARHRMEKILGTDLEGSPQVLSAIKGITLGVTENAPEGFTDDFRFTGTMHLFAVSGLHVGMLAVMIWFVLQAARLPRSWAVALIIPMLFFYVLVTGMKMGSIRSASMVSLLLCGSVLYRRSPLFNTLAAAAFLQLAWDTNALFSAGWQFSYSVVFAILALAPLIEPRFSALHAADPFLPPVLLTQQERWRFAIWKHLAGLAAVSTAAWIGSLIPTMIYFHLISFSAIGANFLAVPLAFAVLALGALSLLAGGISLWVAGAFNNANWLVTKLLLLVVQGSALLPGGHWFVGFPGKLSPVITVLDLGGASCAVIQNGKEFALINAGRKQDVSGTILPFLESCGANSVRSVLVMKSDALHLGGLPEMSRTLKVECVLIPPGVAKSSVGKTVLSSCAASAQPLQPGEHTTLLRGVDAEILDPPQRSSAEIPNNQLMLRLECGHLHLLFLPQLTPELSQQLLSLNPQALHAEVLVLPLGGSDLISTLAVIRHITPRVIISPADHLRRNGAPSSEWEQILTGEGMELLRQDETGAVMIDAEEWHPKVRTFLSPQKEMLLK